MRLAAALLLSLSLAGCASETAVTGAPVSATRSGAAPEPMAGRWQLASPGAGQCNVTFGLYSGGSDGEGTLAPEGGCPGNFYMGRKWTIEGGALVIRDHNGQPLGQLAHAGPGRFDGKMQNGQPLTLSR